MSCAVQSIGCSERLLNPARVILPRTHEDLLMGAFEDDIGEPRERETFLATAIIYGPSEAEFHPNKQARLRFFAGYFRDLQKVIQEDSDASQDLTFRVN